MDIVVNVCAFSRRDHMLLAPPGPGPSPVEYALDYAMDLAPSRVAVVTNIPLWDFDIRGLEQIVLEPEHRPRWPWLAATEGACRSWLLQTDTPSVLVLSPLAGPLCSDAGFCVLRALDAAPGRVAVSAHILHANQHPAWLHALAPLPKGSHELEDLRKEPRQSRPNLKAFLRKDDADSLMGNSKSVDSPLPEVYYVDGCAAAFPKKQLAQSVSSPESWRLVPFKYSSANHEVWIYRLPVFALSPETFPTTS
jgi:hypothetical protein